MRELLTRLVGMIEDTIIEAEDEPQFTTREHATTGAEEMYRELIMPVLAEAWDEGHSASEAEWMHTFDGHPVPEGELCPECSTGNPYRKAHA